MGLLSDAAAMARGRAGGKPAEELRQYIRRTSEPG